MEVTSETARRVEPPESTRIPTGAWIAVVISRVVVGVLWLLPLIRFARSEIRHPRGTVTHYVRQVGDWWPSKMGPESWMCLAGVGLLVTAGILLLRRRWALWVVLAFDAVIAAFVMGFYGARDIHTNGSQGPGTDLLFLCLMVLVVEGGHVGLQLLRGRYTQLAVVALSIVFLSAGAEVFHVRENQRMARLAAERQRTIERFAPLFDYVNAHFMRLPTKIENWDIYVRGSDGYLFVEFDQRHATYTKTGPRSFVLSNVRDLSGGRWLMLGSRGRRRFVPVMAAVREPDSEYASGKDVEETPEKAIKWWLRNGIPYDDLCYDKSYHDDLVKEFPGHRSIDYGWQFTTRKAGVVYRTPWAERSQIQIAVTEDIHISPHKR